MAPRRAVQVRFSSQPTCHRLYPTSVRLLREQLLQNPWLSFKVRERRFSQNYCCSVFLPDCFWNVCLYCDIFLHAMPLSDIVDFHFWTDSVIKNSSTLWKTRGSVWKMQGLQYNPSHSRNNTINRVNSIIFNYQFIIRLFLRLGEGRCGEYPRLSDLLPSLSDILSDSDTEISESARVVSESDSRVSDLLRVGQKVGK